MVIGYIPADRKFHANLNRNRLEKKNKNKMFSTKKKRAFHY